MLPEDGDDFEFEVGEDDGIQFDTDPETKAKGAEDDDEPETPKSRDEKKHERLALREELAALRAQREADQAELRKLREHQEALAQGLRTVAAPPSGTRDRLDLAYEQQDRLQTEWNARVAAHKEHPITEQEQAEYRKRARQLEEEITEARVERVQRKSAPSAEQQAQQAVNTAIAMEFPAAMADPRSRAVAAAEYAAAIHRGKPATIETAREIMQRVSHEFGHTKQPPASEAEKRKGTGTRSPTNGAPGSRESIQVRPGSLEERLALTFTKNLPNVDKMSRKQRIQHWVNAVARERKREAAENG